MKYRIYYPLRGLELKIEDDLQIYNDHKIIASLHKLLRTCSRETQFLFDPATAADEDIERLADR